MDATATPMTLAGDDRRAIEMLVAVRGGYLRIVQTLFDLGANVNYIPDYSHQTGLQVADDVSTGHQALREWLREHGGEVADGGGKGSRG